MTVSDAVIQWLVAELEQTADRLQEKHPVWADQYRMAAFQWRSFLNGERP